MIRLLQGDCREILPTLEAESFHAAITDPPYHLTSITQRFGAENAAPAQFGKDGAFARASRGFMGQQWDGGDVAFRPETWDAVHRVLKPGAFMVCFASTRGYHRMVCAIEDAGFVIHPMLGWLFGSGLPKATRFKLPELDGWRYGLQALKPALEPICLAQKPLDGTGSENWARHGCGGLNIDACRVPTVDGYTENCVTQGVNTARTSFAPAVVRRTFAPSSDGRWPPNVLHDGSDEVEEAFAAFGERPGQIATTRSDETVKTNTIYSVMRHDPAAHDPRGDTGTASRFFYCAKADASDRVGSKHPTVKPTVLMRWLCTLITPPGGRIIDPFAGTGSTGLAADQLGFDATLIEQSEEYARDMRRKVTGDCPLITVVA